MEILGPVNESGVQFLNDLGHKITSVSADDKQWLKWGGLGGAQPLLPFEPPPLQ